MKKYLKYTRHKVLLLSIVTGIFFLAQDSYGKALRSVDDSLRINVPLGGNSWSSGDKSGGNVSKYGIENWTNESTMFTTYVRVEKTGIIKVWLNMKVPDGKSKIELSITGRSKKINAEGIDAKDYYVGEWKIVDTGYVAFQIKGLFRTGSTFGDIATLELEGTAIDEHTAFTKNNEGDFFYWGRRGPSVHLNYVIPENTNVEWFYNEVTVPKGQDVIGSYFMADGFGEGYFGMQVNSPTERHILFSVWSPFKTNNPKEIPEDQKIQLLKKSEGVHAGEFGDEGSGGQSYMNYSWKAETTYKFLLHGKPDGTNHTTYSAYFYTPEDGRWHLIASFRRPATNTWLKHLYSFLENFSPEQGNKVREVLFGNQWICTSEGKWIEIDKMRFTTDNTGRKGYRMDYAGGLKENEFYLRNCGFFNDYTPFDSWFVRPLLLKQPVIDLKKLP